MTFHVEGLERKTADNPYGYTEDQLATRKRMLKEMEALYPDVEPLWREWVYDLCVNTLRRRSWRRSRTASANRNPKPQRAESSTH